MSDSSDPPGRLYTDLAHLWPLMSPPEDYREESDFILGVLRDRLGDRRLRLLDLGSGGGHHLHRIAARHDAEAVDLSAPMLEHSRRLNPGVRHHLGDMRTVRLGARFDAVLIHDAISYMTTEDDLLAAFTTARAHLDPGGLLLVVPDDYADTFVSPHVSHETRREGGRELTFVEYSTTEPSNGAHLDTTYVYFFVEGGRLRVEVDHHRVGLFPLAAWDRLLREAGFTPERLPYPFGERGRDLVLWACAPAGADTAGPQ